MKQLSLILSCIMFLMVPIASFASDSDMDRILSCEQQFKLIAKSQQLKSFEKKLHAVQRYEQQCALYGVYVRYLADLYYTYGRYSEANKILSATIATADYDTRILEFWLALTEYEMNNIDTHKQLAEQMLHKYPQWYGGYYHLGAHYTLIGEMHKAKKILEQAMTLEKQGNARAAVDINTSLTYVYYCLGDYKKSKQHFLAAFEAYPLGTLLTRPCCAAAAISFVKLGDMREARDLLQWQQKYDAGVEKYPKYQEAKKVYDDAIAAGAKIK